jgi:hypothetical protein
MLNSRVTEIAHNPRDEYQSRLKARMQVAAEVERRHITLGNFQLGVAAAGALAAWMVVGRHWLAPEWLLLPAAVFALLALLHERVIRAHKRAERAAAFYEKGIARLEDRWAGRGDGGERFDDPAHPYAEDLDLFGKGSLFELLSTARLRSGEETLARWLLNPADPAEVRERQAAVEELRHRLDLREEISMLGEDLRSGIDPGALARWAEKPLLFDSRGLRIAAAVLAALMAGAVVVWAAFGIPEFFLAVAAVEAAFVLRLRARVQLVTEGVGEPAYGLALLSEMLARFEREPFSCPRLAALRKAFETGGAPPSRRIAHLNRLIELLDSADHLLMRLVNLPLLYKVQLAFAIEAWRKESGGHVRTWLEAAGQIEALCALANYAYEHPADSFPEFAEGAHCFEGEGLAHPLIAESRVVANDVRLCGEPCVLVVSGSNMSGKSTLLRTVGVNAVLAMVGAPVRARRLRLSPMAIGASIRTLDSLHSGTSRFYAEITRIRLLVELTKAPLPLLFLLDELLQGTNSHDRLIGAEAVIRTLVDRGAIGLLTTHDLALADIADALAPRARNVHFEDHLTDGKITFDYRLRSGVVQKSNALELMRSVGLEV